MAWGFAWLWSKKEQPLSQEQKERVQRRCKAFLSGLEGCRRANPGPGEESDERERGQMACRVNGTRDLNAAALVEGDVYS